MTPLADRTKSPKITFIQVKETGIDEKARRQIRTHAGIWSRAHDSDKSIRQRRVTCARRRKVCIQSKDFKSYEPASPKDIYATGASPELPRQAAPSLEPNLLLQDAFLGSKFDVFMCLPQLPSERKRSHSLALAKSYMYTILGEDFLRQCVPMNHNFSLTLYTGALLITYARYYSLTGKASELDLLELKGDLIRLVNSSLQAGKNIPNLQDLFAIFALGSPAVCLTTSQLPSSTAARQSLMSAREEVPACRVDPKLAKEIAFKDHLLHRQTLARVLLDIGAPSLRQSTLGRQFLRFFILYTHNAAAVGPYTTAFLFDESDLCVPSTIENQNARSGIWHSPLYCPHGLYVGAKEPLSAFDAKTTDLCREVQRWLGSLEPDDEETQATSRLSNRQQHQAVIERFQPYTGTKSSESGYIYESCRLVAQLMLRAQAFDCSIEEAAYGTPFPTLLEAALRKTDPLNLWGPQIGLLYWVILVSTATTGSHFDLNTTAILTSAVFGRLTISNAHIEVGLRPLQKLKWFNDLCTSKKESLNS